MKNKYSQLRHSQEGLASIIVAVLIMLLLTLIVLAMAQNSRREQRQTLDRQLSSQAFYNAESGINDTIAFLRTNPPLSEKTQCDSSSLDPTFFKEKIDGNSGTNSYSCILWDLSPESLEFAEVKVNTPEVMPIENNNAGQPITELTIEWQATSVTNNDFDFNGCAPPSTSNFVPAPGPGNPVPGGNNRCDAGILRVELVDTTTLNRDALRNNNYVAFFVPKHEASVATTPYSEGQGSGSQGRVEHGNCQESNSIKKCQIKITGLPAIPGKKYQLVLRSIYKANSVRVSGQTPGGAVSFKNGQAVIDSTGKANDVLRRLQVRVPIEPQYDREPFAIHTGDSICKLLSISPSSLATSADPAICPID